MLWIPSLCVLAALATLARSRAQLKGSANEGESYDPDSFLLPSDDLSTFEPLTDENAVGDNFAFTDPSTNDYTSSLFADNLNDCSPNNGLQPSRKIRARDKPLCPTPSNSDSPPIDFPNLDDINVVDPANRQTTPEVVRKAGLGYYNICPQGYKAVPDWVICGLQGFSRGLATWEYDVYDADICKF